MPASFVLSSSVALPPVCAVCIDGYARGMGHTCSKCTSRHRTAGATIAAVVVMVLIAAVALRLRSSASFCTEANTERPASSRGLHRAWPRFRMARPFQALKIVFVSWQIITQVGLFCDADFHMVTNCSVGSETYMHSARKLGSGTCAKGAGHVFPLMWLVTDVHIRRFGVSKSTLSVPPPICMTTGSRRKTIERI